ncbi:hypothetical protein Ahy_A10g050397 isoform B [Arachis hypogaea]|uniref:Uncharacterized protein n=1 Tax=Arachis hypogaea TaxID=3818 RepID=A0A445B9A0_ARAHY|nr:hypothetical protein Ahy_A10g050397 isoform B [Arachis hypogaea]
MFAEFWPPPELLLPPVRNRNCFVSLVHNSQKPSTENPFEDDVLTPYIFPLSGFGRRSYEEFNYLLLRCSVLL